MTIVSNKDGAKINYDLAVQLMDDDIREELHRKGFHTPQEFFTAYEEYHEREYGSAWELSKANPTI